jgi:hypothetical protein
MYSFSFLLRNFASQPLLVADELEPADSGQKMEYQLPKHFGRFFPSVDGVVYVCVKILMISWIKSLVLIRPL